MKEGSEQTKPGPQLGFCEWLRVGEYERVERALADLGELDVQLLRTGFSWADYLTPQGPKWFDWLIPKLTERVEVLPCFTYTPPSLGREPRTSSPPRRTKDYADFLDHALERYGRHFEYVELWNEPNNLNDWDYLLDPGWEAFAEMIGMAAHWCRHLGYKTVLGGMSPTDPAWLQLMGQKGILDLFDVVGLHGFPGTWDADTGSWKRPLDGVTQALAQLNPKAKVWMTEGGYSTWRHDELNQVGRLLDVFTLPLERCYLYQLHDLHPDEPHQSGWREDVKHYHFGVKRHDGTPKLLYRLWNQHGVNGVQRIYSKLRESTARTPYRNSAQKPVVVIGGAGFIGSNLVHHLCSEGRPVRILDSLARPGVEWNLLQLQKQHGDLLEADVRDVRDPVAVRQCLSDAACVYHFAAQVAVTTSLEDPWEDFLVNLEGTLNVLETLRLHNPVPLLYTSTNKVYGRLAHLELTRANNRYVPAHEGSLAVSERTPLELHSPYGCSKGAADQYILDYARSYNLPTTVFRMSCIYGPRQWGTEDQGWVAHFLRRALAGQPITIYGDGAQVRDILYVDDLIDAMTRAIRHIDQTAGEAFNVGGGPENSVSLRELMELMETHLGLDLEVEYAPWRQGDQRYYVSSVDKIQAAIGWRPTTCPALGLRHLHDWLTSEQFVNGRQRLISGKPTPLTPSSRPPRP